MYLEADYARLMCTARQYGPACAPTYEPDQMMRWMAVSFPKMENVTAERVAPGMTLDRSCVSP